MLILNILSLAIVLFGVVLWGSQCGISKVGAPFTQEAYDAQRTFAYHGNVPQMVLRWAMPIVSDSSHVSSSNESIILVSGTSISRLSYEGIPVWKKELDEYLVGPGALQDGLIWVSDIEGTAYCMDEEDGTVIWKCTPRHSNLKTTTSPIIVHSKLCFFIDHGDNELVILDEDGKILQEVKLSINSINSDFCVSPDGDLIFISKPGVLTCTTLNGSVIWHTNLGASEATSMTTNYLAMDGKNIVATCGQDLYWVNRNGHVQARTKLNGFNDCRPCIAPGIIVIKSVTGVLQAYSRDTHLQWSREVGSSSSQMIYASQSNSVFLWVLGIGLCEYSLSSGERSVSIEERGVKKRLPILSNSKLLLMSDSELLSFD